MNAQEMLLDLHRMAALPFNPAPTYVYKPRPDGSGVALKLNLRLTPKFEKSDGDGSTFIKDIDGGLFLELVGQDGKTEDGKNAKFGWNNSEKKLTAKIGLADQLGLLTAIREVRTRGKAVPKFLQPKNEADASKAARSVSLFHKFGKGSTAINYVFDAEQSTLGVSKSATQRRMIGLTLMDEVQIEAYLRLSLDRFITLGMR